MPRQPSGKAISNSRGRRKAELSSHTTGWQHRSGFWWNSLGISNPLATKNNSAVFSMLIGRASKWFCQILCGTPDTTIFNARWGATALHNVLVNVLAVMVSKGFSVLEPAKYAEIMESSLTQLGETNAEGSWVEGSDFWKRGAEGASGLFNGRPGNRVLQAKILENLPPLIVT